MYKAVDNSICLRSSLHTFNSTTPNLHRYAFGAILASVSVLSHFNVLAFSSSGSAARSDLQSQFMELDDDHNSQLSYAEASRDWDIQPQFTKADFNGNGTLEMAEYLNFKNALKISSINRDYRTSSNRNGLIVNGSIVKG